MAVRAPVASRTPFFGSTRAKLVATAARPVIARRQVAPKAFFGFGSKSSSSDAAAAPQYYICIDCGYIYDGDFKKAPSSYRCPVCSSPKNRFKVYKGVVRGKPNNTGAALKQRFQKREW